MNEFLELTVFIKVPERESTLSAQERGLAGERIPPAGPAQEEELLEAGGVERSRAGEFPRPVLQWEKK